MKATMYAHFSDIVRQKGAEAALAVCPYVGVCGDIGNPFFVGEDSLDFFRAFAKDIRHVHIKDYIRADLRPEGGTRMVRGPRRKMAQGYRYRTGHCPTCRVSGVFEEHGLRGRLCHGGYPQKEYGY